MKPDGDRGTLPDQALIEALEAARRRASELKEEMERLGSEMRSAEQEVHLLDQLLALRDPKRGGSISAGVSEELTTKRSAELSSPKRPHPVVLEAVNELASAGRPLHISELMRLLEDRNVAIPGAGNQANLIAHLSRSDQVVRPSRGMYGLATWNLPERPPLKRAKRRRVRGPSKSRQ